MMCNCTWLLCFVIFSLVLLLFLGWPSFCQKNMSFIFIYLFSFIFIYLFSLYYRRVFLCMFRGSCDSMVSVHLRHLVSLCPPKVGHIVFVCVPARRHA